MQQRQERALEPMGSHPFFSGRAGGTIGVFVDIVVGITGIVVGVMGMVFFIAMIVGIALFRK